MAKFSDLLTIMRREVIAEALGDGGFDDTTDLYPMLYNASAEIAAALAFPRALQTGTLADNAASISATSTTGEVLSVTIGTSEVTRVQRADLKRKSALTNTKLPRVYNFDRARGATIDLAPANTSGAGVAYEVEHSTQIDPTTITSGDVAWSSNLEEFHYLIPLRAGVFAWEAVEQYDRANYWNNRFNAGLQLLAQHLGIPFQPLQRPSQAQQGGRQ